jgi:two-component system, chemotaxis family, chemotaxis protein CheY
MQRRVLIADDSMLMRRLVKDALVSDGWEVVAEAVDGFDAIEKYQQFRPDAVTLDITMPGCDGLEAVVAIVGLDPQAKIVVVSALNQVQLTAQAIHAGAKGFIVKPFLPQHLREMLRASVGEPAQA